MMAYDNPVAYNAIHDVLKRGIEINKFHKMLRCCGSDRLEKAARIHGFKLIGEFNTCEECAVSKARQKNVKKEWKRVSQIPKERLYIDISSIKNASYGGSKFWVLIVDTYTDYCWNVFLKNEADLKDKMFTLFTDLKIAGIDVKYIRCDDSGKSKAFYNACRSTDYLIKFEFSGPRTPHVTVTLRESFRLYKVEVVKF